MSLQKERSGVWTALVTPFMSDYSIDVRAFDELLQKQADAGIRGLIVAGSTGEGFTLSVQEKLSLIKRARHVLKNQVQIMCGIGSSNTAQSAELAEMAVEAGADALLVVSPPYSKPSLQGLLLHFREISQRARGVPLCLYHIPSRTAQKLSAEQLAILCSSTPHMPMMKEASGDLGFFHDCLMASPQTLIFSGDDLTFLPALAVGAAGLMSVITNIFPRPVVDLQRAFLSGDYLRARVLFDIIQPLSKALYCESNPGPLKAALEEIGVCRNILRLPLAPVEESSRALIKNLLGKTVELLGKEGYD
ncbi:MAG: 4-hydroxy-tetrahydrodipicolinate synthase [Oligoflexales bacterium]|nr:4-hydroxy-tetrahydrodipicolinate synthase [Oligoflexales bacterium]